MRTLYILPVLLLFAARVGAVPGEGSCTGYKFRTYPDDPTKINETLPLRILRHGAPVYPSPSGGDSLSSRTFGELVEPVTLSADPAGGRIQIKRPGDAKPLGWMERTDLLCRNRPLIENYIERKAFIRTATGPNDSSEPVRSFPGPDLDDCPNPGMKGCRTLSRFELLFVFARNPDTKRLLLAHEYYLNDDDILVGWVPEEQTVPWNTRLGLRPADQVEETRMYPNARAAATADDTRAYPVKGNRDGRWYTYPHHPPLLDREDVDGRAVYKVAAPGPKARIDEDPYLPNQGTGSIVALKGADVFFLIDGTESMTPHIRAVEEVASTLAEELTGDKEGGHRSNHYRFGFRIFRDHYADTAPALDCQGGLCEKLLIDREDCSQNSRTMDESRRRFLAAIKEVKASSNDHNDYPNRLFAGIEQAIQDMGGCNDRLKVLIVIGDHGDRLPEVPDRLRTKIRAFASDSLIFFIQTPAESDTIDYQDAYAKFKWDARAVLRLVYPDGRFLGRDIKRKATLLSLSDAEQTKAKIKEIVDQYSSSRAVNELMTAIRGGESLDDFLHDRMGKGDLPVLFWERVYRKLCAEDDRRLGRQCTEPVDHVVDYAYVPVSDDWTEEVWLGLDDLDFWLRTLRDLSKTGGRSATEERAAFIRALISLLETKIGKPLRIQTGESFEEFMWRKSGLPVRAHSPLLGYELRELRRIEPCELRRLKLWAGSIYELLNGIKASPRLKPSFVLEDNTSKCNGITDQGRKLQKMRLAPASSWKRLGRDERATFEHEIAGGLIRYWLPQAYLP
ncbi:hypothetical protein [Candidatus Thiosymbion oneisti]|uniref:hypothetical protein n=1 Tax=Candidatus Thiosymbion oneisti TaxID=589554 RepID=UPI000A5430E4|nr:hypothetical protein [Candidatus Thiosymbion oneisti]